LNEEAVGGRPLSPDGKLEICALGIAFYELFSGGRQIEAEAGTSQQLPAPLLSRPTRSLSLPTGQTAAGLGVRSNESSEFKSAIELIDTTGERDELFPLMEDAIDEGGGVELFGSHNFDSNIGSKKGEDAKSTLDDMSALNNCRFTYNLTNKRSHSLDNLSPKAMVRTPSSMASISVEPLKLLGLPTALCDLISNMIDSVNGDVHGSGEAYDFISEVRDDLKLMIDCPNVYLQDVDLVKAANGGLEFGGSLHGREAELQALRECYQRSISSEYEVAMICGTSGIGKSKLSQEFARSATNEDEDGGSIFLSGRFDKVQSQPLHAISSAFDNYCAWLTVKNCSTAEKVATALKENLGEEMASLVAAMPNLVNILGDDFDSKKINENDAAVDAQERLRYLFCQFVEVIARCHEEPLILFLDDCQWIDNASAALLNQILMTSEPAVKDHRLFFFGCCRDDEMGNSHPLNLMLSSVSTFGTKTTKIHLTPMSKDAVNKMVSTTLSLLPRITRPFANILHHKTKGSPLFVKQLMVELYKQRLLYPSLSRRRWVWEADKILDMKIPENVATFITKSFNRLPSDVLSALVVLSCFGARAEISLIEVLEREINQSLIAPLEAAIAASVLGKKDGEFYFMHDKLQEAAYSMMRPAERCLHHNLYGQALGFVAIREKDDRLLLTAVRQINHGGPQAVINHEHAVLVANMNLDAGKKAMDMSDFFLAYTFFNHGISYLPRGHWDEQYALSLEFFNLAAKCALMNAEHDRVKMLTGEIIRYAKCFQDRCQAIFITSTLLTRSGSGPEAVKVMNSTLSSLDEKLPTVITPTVIEDHLDNTKAQLAGLSDDTLLSYPAMVSPSKILAMEFLVRCWRF
jgi:predicted ATPase